MICVACSDVDAEIGYLNKLDKDVDFVDVLDDYTTERKSVEKRAGYQFYSLGDHCARMFVGPVFSKYDSLDE
jgi:hypothetical protein